MGIVSFNQHRILYQTKDGLSHNCPRFGECLNAMHEAEKLLFPSRMHTYSDYLRDGSEGTFEWHRIHSTAAQRREAYLRTMNLLRK